MVMMEPRPAAAGQVHIQDVLPVGQRRALDARVDRVDAGVVDEDVDRAEARQGGVAQGQHVRLLGHVGHDRQHVRADCGGGGLQGGFGAAAQDELGAVAVQALGDGPAQAAAAAGDDGDMAGQVEGVEQGGFS